MINAFNKSYPNVHVNYKPVGNNLPTVLATAVAGGHPPDMADIAQPGTIAQFAKEGKLKPITYAQSTMAKYFAPAWTSLGTFSGKLYALPFKAANKSVVWYSVPTFKAAGVTPPKTFSQLLADRARRSTRREHRAYSIGGSDGWTLTDLFENIYLRTFGAAKYDQLSQHKIKWTDPSVTTALKTMAKIVGDTGNIYGGTSGALQYGFNDSVTNAFSSPAKAAMVFEADFVGGVITSSTKAKPKTGFNTFTWPSITPGPDASAVEIAGDLFVTFNDNPAIEAFVKYLTTPQAAEIWAKQGGFGTGNHNVPASAPTPDAIDKSGHRGSSISQAKSVVFDMSDNQPPAFGATTGQGEWGLFPEVPPEPGRTSAGSRSSSRAVGGGGLQEGQRRELPARVAAEPPVVAAPPPPGRRARSSFGRYLVGAFFLAPALFMLGVWMVYPAVYTVIRSFFGPTGFFGHWVGIDNYKTLFTTSTLTTAIKNNAIWVAVVPAMVTAVGLVFAVLTERIRWAVAFKTAVFLPMAISAFATGVTWRIMYQQDPSIGAINALGKTISGCIQPGRRALERVPLDTVAAADEASGGALVLKTPLSPGHVAVLGLTGIAPDQVPKSSVQAVKPAPKPGEITGVVWRDFKPGGGKAGVVETGELGLPGVTVELRNAAGKTIQSTKSKADGTFDFAKVAAGTYNTAIGAQTFAKPFGGFAWLGPNLIVPSLLIAYIWIWAGFAMVVIGAGLAAMPR